MRRIWLSCAAIVVVLLPAANAELLFDTGSPGRWGKIVKQGTPIEALVQPFQTAMSGWADRIGIAIGSGADPNHVGFKVTLTDMNVATDVRIPGTPIADSWNMVPISGPTLAYVYTDIQPIFLDRSKVYGLVVEPGDTDMYGAVALTLTGHPAWVTSDGWATNANLGWPTCVRVYGTPVPEPSSLAALSTVLAAFLVTRSRRRRFPL